MSEESFDALGLMPETLDAIENAGYTKPTPVQAAAIPVIRTGANVIAQAQTGTGKTAAFAIPVSELIVAEGPLQALFLAPTRELARQVAAEFERMSAARGVNTIPIYGGVSIENQVRDLKTAQIAVATPGRLLDLINRKAIKLGDLKVFGLDEADEMLSMGFEPDVLEIERNLPENRQTLLFSATITHDVARFAGNFVKDAVELDLSSDAVAAISVTHLKYEIEENKRRAALLAIIRSGVAPGGIVFCNTRVETFVVGELLEREGYRVGVLNGELAQNARERVLSTLRKKELDYLVATDIAARGIDVSWLPAVINYEMPDSPEVYVHRTGRTGRAGNVGTAHSLVGPTDVHVVHYLEKFFEIRFEPATLPTRADQTRALADRRLGYVLDGLDAGGELEYGEHIVIARRLADSEDGLRDIARLIAFYDANTTRVAAPADVEEKATDKYVLSTDVDEDELGEDEPSEGDAQPRPTEIEDEPGHGRGRRGGRGGRGGRERAPEPEEKIDTAAGAPDDDSAATDQAPEKEEKRSRRRTRRSKRDDDATEQTDDRPKQAPKAGADPARAKKSSGGELSGQAIADWIQETSNGRVKLRSARAIADHFGCTTEEVNDTARDFDGLDRARGRRNMWRVVDGNEGRGSNEDTKVGDAAESEESGGRRRRRSRKKPSDRGDSADSGDNSADRDNSDRDDSGERKRSRSRSRKPRGESGDSERADKGAGSQRGKSSGGRGERGGGRGGERTSRRRDDGRRSRSSRGRSERGPSVVEKLESRGPAPTKMVNLRVNIGKDHKVEVDDATLASQLAEFAGFDDSDVGALKMKAKHSLVEVAEPFWRDFVETLQDQEMHGITLKVSRPKKKKPRS